MNRNKNEIISILNNRLFNYNICTYSTYRYTVPVPVISNQHHSVSISYQQTKSTHYSNTYYEIQNDTPSTTRIEYHTHCIIYYICNKISDMMVYMTDIYYLLIIL